MKALFIPAVKLLNRLRYTTKFTLICVIAGVVAAVLVGQIYVQANDTLQFTEREQQGLEVIESAMGVLTVMQGHRGVTSGLLGGDATLEPKVAAAAQAVDDAMQKMDAVLAGPGADFALTPAWTAIKQQWQPLKARQ